MSLKLNQVIALVGGRKTKAEKLLTTIHHGWKPAVITGITRTYSPKDEDGEVFPAEQREVQMRIEDELVGLREELTDFWDLVSTQEATNGQAMADIKVDGKLLISGVPVTVLLFLEKQLIKLETLIQNLPILPTDKEWRYDPNKRCHATESEQTTKTAKVKRPIVLYDATKEHPAQTELISEDVTIGHWSTIHLSGAIPEQRRHEMLVRVRKLQDAVKVAREQANNMDAEEFTLGETLLKYLFDHTSQ